VERLAHRVCSICKSKRNAHHGQILRLGRFREVERGQRIMKPGRTWRKPALDFRRGVLRRDMSQERLERAAIVWIEQRVAPYEPIVANAKCRPAGEPPPLADRHDEVSRLAELQIAPANVLRVAANEISIRRGHPL